jgi:hypothetical protein
MRSSPWRMMGKRKNLSPEERRQLADEVRGLQEEIRALIQRLERIARERG